MIALAKAANRFLVNLGQVQIMHQRLPTPAAAAFRDDPDTAGFRQAFGTHYKTKLE